MFERLEKLKWLCCLIIKYLCIRFIIICDLRFEAEFDRIELGRLNAIEAYEAKVMKDVKGWVPGQSVYHGRYFPSEKIIQKQVDRLLPSRPNN